MKLTKTKETKQIKYKKILHNKNASEDLNNLTNTKNYFLSKLINSNTNINKIKASNAINEDLPNLKSNIQSIFSNDDKKQKAIQYLIKIRKDRNSSPSTDFRKILSDISCDNRITNNKKFKKEKEIIITPYNNNKYKYTQQMNNKPIITSFDLSQKSLDKNHIKNSNIIEDYNYTVINNKQNLCNFNSPFSINNRSNQNKSSNKNNTNKTFDKFYTNENNPINNYQNYINSSLKNNYAYFNYMKNYNISRIKNKILSLENLENNNIDQENRNISIINNTSINNKDDNISFYIHKKPIYSKLNIKNNLTYRNIKNSNIVIKEIGNNKNRKYIVSEIEKNDNKIKINTIKSTDNNKKTNGLKSKKNVRLNPDKNFKKFDNNLLDKKNTIQFDCISKNKKYEKNKKKCITTSHFELNINGINKNKFVFNNEGEIFEFIKNKYNKEKQREILLEENEEIVDKRKFIQKNEKLENEINKLKYENKLYKKELFDITNQYNDLFKEINLVKEENEKLKDNIINNMINEDNNEE